LLPLVSARGQGGSLRAGCRNAAGLALPDQLTQDVCQTRRRCHQPDARGGQRPCRRWPRL